MAKRKGNAAKTSQPAATSINSTKMLQTINSPDHEDHSENKSRRRSERTKGLPVPTYNLEQLTNNGATSDETILSTPALARPAKVSNGAPQSVNNDSSNPSIEDGKRSKAEDHRQSKNSSRSKQEHEGATLTKSRKRKTATSSAPAPIKKQKVDNSTSTRQRKAATKPRVKTAKEKCLAAPAEDKRPLPWGEPEVWAETRPELCEALPYFHCWQGAGHTNKGHVLAMLLDEDRGERAYMDEEIAIARAGGGIKKNASGEYCQVEDHDAEKGRIKAFINNKTNNIPLHIIIGQKNLHCPSKIPYRYCVGLTVHITDHWNEKSNGHTVVKFRFEKIDLETKSWFAAADSVDNFDITDVKVLRHECSNCNATNPQVFASGWMCLNAGCDQFWTMNGAIAPEAQEYNPDFLKERSVYRGAACPPYEMIPDLIQPNTNYGQDFPVSHQCWQGIVCNLCGRCNMRRQWDAWRCRTKGCPFEHQLPLNVIPASSVLGDTIYGYTGHGLNHDDVSEESIECQELTYGFYRECVYQLGNGLTITHLISNNVINAAPNGPDDLFCQLQKEDMGLERLPMKQCVVKDSFTRHFSHNFGMPYNYVVGHDNSTSMADAPVGIKEAVRRMTWAAKRNIADSDFINFNEVLAIGYFETMKMGYHDDGEVSLGPTVASLSLGCPAKMTWRLKSKYWCGFRDKDRNHYDPKMPILPGCRKPEVRRELNELAKTVTTAELDAAAKIALAFAPRESKTAPVVLEMDLRHGDYMVMHGASMQTYYEHMVFPTDKLRFGLTCRYVKPEMVPEAMQSLGDFTLDPANPYDGDLKIYEEHIKKRAKLAKEREEKMKARRAARLAALA